MLPEPPRAGHVYRAWSARDWTYGEPLTARGNTGRAVFEAFVGTDDYLCVSLETDPDAKAPTEWVGGLFL